MSIQPQPSNMIDAHIPNIMDRSRFGGDGVRFVTGAAEAADAVAIFVDLDRCDDINLFAALGGHTIGFGAHVDTDRLGAAEAAGFDEVMARSAFFRRLPELLATHGVGSTGTG